MTRKGKKKRKCFSWWRKRKTIKEKEKIKEKAFGNVFWHFSDIFSTLFLPPLEQRVEKIKEKNDSWEVFHTNFPQSIRIAHGNIQSVNDKIELICK